MSDKFVEFFEGIFVEKKIDAFTRCQLAGLVFALATLWAAACFRFNAQATEIVHAIFVFCGG